LKREIGSANKMCRELTEDDVKKSIDAALLEALGCMRTSDRLIHGQNYTYIETNKGLVPIAIAEAFKYKRER
jgi:hypothetical protein